MSNITQKPIKPNKVDTSKITFSDIKSIGTSGSKHIFLNHGGDFAKLFVQSPEMNIPFDSGTYYPENENSGKYPIKSSLDNVDTNPAMKDFHDMLDNMDKHLIKCGLENATKWFGAEKWFKKKGEDVDKITEYYHNMLKVSTDPDGEPNGKWAPSFAFKIIKKDGKISCDVYDSNKVKLHTDDNEEDPINLEHMFKKGTKVKMIVSCNGVWVSSVGWGCTWRTEQIKIDVPTGFSGYAFDDSDEDDGTELARTDSVAQPKSESVEGGSDKGGSAKGDSDNDEPLKDNFVDDSDDAEESDGDESEGEEVAKVVKRKVKKAN